MRSGRYATAILGFMISSSLLIGMPGCSKTPGCPKKPDALPADYAAIRQQWQSAFKYSIPPTPLPDDGVERLRAAIQAAPASARVVFVPLLPDYEAAVFFQLEDETWRLDSDLLLRTQPEMNGAPISQDTALKLVHWHASEAARQAYEHRMLWQDGITHRPDGTWECECGMSNIAGPGFQIILAPNGELASIKRVFSPD
jgi:hypothetical protein